MLKLQVLGLQLDKKDSINDMLFRSLGYFSDFKKFFIEPCELLLNGAYFEIKLR